MRRRTVVFAGAAGAMLAAAGVRAQQAGHTDRAPKPFRIGLLVASTEVGGRRFIAGLTAELRRLGYVAGENLLIDARYANGDSSRFGALADELIALEPDLLAGVEWTARALKAKTNRVPIVLTSSTDPIGAGLIESMPRPGTNVTGLAFRIDQLIAKQVEILSELGQQISRVALLSYAARGDNDPGAPIAAKWEASAREAVVARTLRLTIARARDATSLAKAFVEIQKARADAVVVTPVFTWFGLRDEMIAHARRLRMPFITALSASFVEAGLLAYYGADVSAAQRLAARIMDRVLKGESPANIPVEHPARFEFVLNARTARDIGITLPASLLARADRVIE